MTSNIVVDTSMQIRCARDELAAQLGIVGRGLSTRPSVQIFSSVLMQAAAGRLELAATDMEISVRSGLTADVEGDGSAAVPGRLLGEIVKLLPEEEVDLAYNAEESSLHVTSGSASYRLGTYAVEDFPKLPDVETVELTRVAATPFLETVRCVSRAAGRDESRPVLTGVLVRLAGDTFVMAATDSYRLSVKETSLEGAAAELEAIVPARALDELRRIAAGEGEISVGMLDNHVVFHAADTWLTSRRIDGQFPDYTKLIPDASEFVVDLSLPRAELLDVVRRVGVMAHRASPLRLRLAEGELTVSAQTQDVGEARESLPVAHSGEPLEVGFNADYLRDGIESVEGDEVAVKLINPLRPGLLQGDGDSFRYLIMPIRLAG
jgi:DNA polymerase III subunit beta